MADEPKIPPLPPAVALPHPPEADEPTGDTPDLNDDEMAALDAVWAKRDQAAAASRERRADEDAAD
jgi:hypothetical protein